MRPVLVMVLLSTVALGGCIETTPAEPTSSTATTEPPTAQNVSIEWTPRPATTGQTAEFQYVLDGPPGSTLTATWQIDSNGPVSADIMRHRFEKTGIHSVSLELESSDGWTLERSAQVPVMASNQSNDPNPPDVDPETESEPKEDPAKTPDDFTPHAIVGIADSGFNVYHEVYRRPHLTVHPCEYIRDFPCDLPALDLTLDAASYEEALAADRDKWESIQVGDAFWIPGTVFVFAGCVNSQSASSSATSSGPDLCILDDDAAHGTGTSSSVLSENPDALLAVVEGNSGSYDLMDEYAIPTDVRSFSWGAAAPLVGTGLLLEENPELDYVFIAASGNEGAFPVVLDGTKASQHVITVGAADGASRTEPGYSGWKTMDFVSEYCRPTADVETLAGINPRYCGTSFSAPTFAGAVSRVILELRLESGFDGTMEDGIVDPILDIDYWELLDALRATASYTPDSPFESDPHDVPLLEAAPYYQWGWGYIARNEVPATVACLLEDVCPERPADTVAYMEALWTFRSVYGEPVL